MRPGIFWLAAPFANGGTGAPGKSKRAFVAGSLDNGVIGGAEKCVIEEKDGLLGCGGDKNISWVNCFVESGDGFAQQRRARGFGVAAPVFQEGIVCGGFESEEISDGAGFGVGGGEEIFGGEFVFVEILLDAERRNLHWMSFAKTDIDVYGQIPASESVFLITEGTEEEHREHGEFWTRRMILFLGLRGYDTGSAVASRDLTNRRA